MEDALYFRFAPKPLREQDYTWMYQLTPAPPRLGDFNDYFVCAIKEKDSAYFSHFLHHYESVLNAMAHRFLDFYYLPQNLLADLKQTFALTLWEQFLKYDAENAIPLLQIVHPIVKKQWHTMVARKVGALTMPEKVYAVCERWRRSRTSAAKRGYRRASAKHTSMRHFPSAITGR